MKLNIHKSYANLFYSLFFIYLLGILSFGRAFAILHIKIGPAYLFVTEIILLLSLPVIIVNYKNILVLPKTILSLISDYFLLGALYLGFGIISNNFYALRDSVLCTYILFFYISFITFSDKRKLMVLLFIVLISNIISIFAGGAFNAYFHIIPAQWQNFFNTIKAFNLCLYHGFVISLLIPYMYFTNSRKRKIFCYLVIVLNLYSLLFLSNRAAWLSSVILCIYFIILLKARFIKHLFLLILPLIMLYSVSYGTGCKFLAFDEGKDKASKIYSTLSFIKNNFLGVSKNKNITPASQQEPIDATIPANTLLKYYDNLSFRLNVWKTAINFGLESPFLGKGFGVYPVYLNWDNRPIKKPQKNYFDSGVIPTHNHLISIFYKMGFLGLGLFLLINIVIFTYGLSYLKICKQVLNKIFIMGALGSIVFWHSMALFFDVIDSPPTSIFLWIFIGLVLACVEADKNSMRPENG